VQGFDEYAQVMVTAGQCRGHVIKAGNPAHRRLRRWLLKKQEQVSHAWLSERATVCQKPLGIGPPRILHQRFVGSVFTNSLSQLVQSNPFSLIGSVGC